MRNIKFQKNSKKIKKKIKKCHNGSNSSHHRLKEDEKGGKEKLSFRSVLTWRIIENSKKIAKKFQKIKQYHYGSISSQNWLKEAEKGRK